MAETPEKPVARTRKRASAKVIVPMVRKEDDTASALRVDLRSQTGLKIADSGEVEPPYPLDHLAALLEENPIHFACCREKSLATVGRGWTLRQKDGDAQDGDKRPPGYDEAFAFVDKPNEEMSGDDLRFAMQMDHESVGNAYVEIVREKDDPKGKVKKAYHVTASTLVIRVLGNRVIGWMQQIGTTKVYFRPFGSDPDDKRYQHPDSREREKPLREIATMRQYHPASAFYGLPDGIPAIIPIQGMTQALVWNLNAFKGRKMPDWLVVVTDNSETEAVADEEAGNETSDQDILEDAVREYLQSMGAGQPGKILYLNLPKGLEVNVDPLESKRDKEGEFLSYLTAMSDLIVACHGVPRRRIFGGTDQGVGTGSGESDGEKYKASIIKPRQRKVERLWDMLIQMGLQIEGWEVKLQEIDTKDELRDAQIAQIYGGQLAVWSTNAILNHLGDEPYDPNEHPWATLPWSLVRLLVMPATLSVGVPEATTKALGDILEEIESAQQPDGDGTEVMQLMGRFAQTALPILRLFGAKVTDGGSTGQGENGSTSPAEGVPGSGLADGGVFSRLESDAPTTDPAYGKTGSSK